MTYTNYESPFPQSRVVMFFLGTLVILDVAGVWSSVLQLDLLQQVQAGGLITPAEAEANDSREATIGILFGITYLVTGVLFLRWFHRLYKNVHWMAQSQVEQEGYAYPPKHTPGWAVGSFFVPFLNLVRPYQIMKDVWQRCAPDHLVNRSGLLSLWWAFWIIGNVLGQIVWRMSDSTDIAALIQLTNLQIVTSLVDIPAALLCMAVVHKTTQFQVDRVERQHELAEAFT